MTTSITQQNKLKKILTKTAAILFWIAVWYALFLYVGEEILIVSPLTVIKRIFALGATAEFWESTLLSLVRIMAGFVCGVIFGTLTAVATTFCKPIYELFRPMLTVIKTTPVASFILLALVWIKRNNVPTFIAFLMVLPIVWANVSEGLVSADKNLLEVAKIFKFNMKKKITDIYIPSVKPYFFAGTTTAMGLAWKAGIAAEVLSLPKMSIGTNLYSSKIYLETTDLFAWTAVVIILSVILEKLLKLALKRLRG